MRLLTGWGHQVVATGSCAEMLDQAAGFTSTPDLIVTDYRLRNGEDGITGDRAVTVRATFPPS